MGNHQIEEQMQEQMQEPGEMQEPDESVIYLGTDEIVAMRYIRLMGDKLRLMRWLLLATIKVIYWQIDEIY